MENNLVKNEVVNTPAPANTPDTNKVVTLVVEELTKRKKKVNGIMETEIDKQSFHKFDITVNDLLPMQKKIDTATYLASRLIGNKLAAMALSSAKMPQILTVRFELNGTVYSTETAAIRAQMFESLRVKVSPKMREEETKKLANMIASQFSNNMKSIKVFLHLMKEEEKINVTAETLIDAAMLAE